MGNEPGLNALRTVLLRGPDPHDAVLIEKIIEKTGEKKLYWNREKNSYAAQYPQLGLSLEFSGNSTFAWSTFTVKTKEGIVLQVSKDDSVFSVLSGLKDSRVELADRLFSEVRKLGEGKIERTIKLLDQL